MAVTGLVKIVPTKADDKLFKAGFQIQMSQDYIDLQLSFIRPDSARDCLWLYR
jgi:hypothetical protein